MKLGSKRNVDQREVNVPTSSRGKCESVFLEPCFAGFLSFADLGLLSHGDITLCSCGDRDTHNKLDCIEHNILIEYIFQLKSNEFICQHVFDLVQSLIDKQIMHNKDELNYKLEELKLNNRIIDKMFCIKVDIIDSNIKRFRLENELVTNTNKDIVNKTITTAVQKITHSKQSVIDRFVIKENNIFSEVKKRVKTAEFVPRAAKFTVLKPQHCNFSSKVSIDSGVDYRSFSRSNCCNSSVIEERADGSPHKGYYLHKNDTSDIFFDSILSSTATKHNTLKQSSLSNFGFSSDNIGSQSSYKVSNILKEPILDTGRRVDDVLFNPVSHINVNSQTSSNVINDCRDVYRVPGTFFKDEDGGDIIHVEPFLNTARVGSAGGTKNANKAFLKSNSKIDFTSFFNGETSTNTPHWFEDTVRWIPGMQKIIKEENRLNLINMPAVIFDKCKNLEFISTSTSALLSPDKWRLISSLCRQVADAQHNMTKIHGHNCFLYWCRYSGVYPFFVDNSINVHQRVKNPFIQSHIDGFKKRYLLETIFDNKKKLACLKSTIKNTWNYLRNILKKDIDKFRFWTFVHEITFNTAKLQWLIHKKKANKLSKHCKHICTQKNFHQIEVHDNKFRFVQQDEPCNVNHYNVKPSAYLNGYDKWTPNVSKFNSFVKYFGFSHNTKFWFHTKFNNGTEEEKIDIINVENAQKFLNDKGSSFSINFNESNKDEQQTSIHNRLITERCIYGYRWKAHIQAMNKRVFGTQCKAPIPFSTRNPKLPKKMDNLTEHKIALFRDELCKVMDKYSPYSIHSKYSEQVNQLYQLCKNEKLVIVETDKTKRNIIMKYDEFIRMGNAFIQGNKDYKRLNKSKCPEIQNKSNKLINDLNNRSTFQKNFLKKCLVYNTHGARVFFNVKDHKPKNEQGNYPLRIIASVWGTPVAGLDFIVQDVLTQACKLVPSYTEDCVQFLEKLDKANTEEWHNGCNWNLCSLDVDSLYPSIPIQKGIDYVVEFVYAHATHIILHDMDHETFRNILIHICFNYEIEFDNKYYLQTRGVPMGARFAPPFAIIFMHMIEETALYRLSPELKPWLYIRYIDDIFMIYNDNQDENIVEIFNTFNSIDPDIKFTIEKPNIQGWLAFLDCEVKIKNNKFFYRWYMKSLHSGNLMNAHSLVPLAMKRSFVANRFAAVIRRSNTLQFMNNAIDKMFNLLLQNEYTPEYISDCLINAIDNANFGRREKSVNLNNASAVLKAPFKGDISNKEIKNTAKKFDEDIFFCNNKFKHLKNLSYKPPKEVTKCKSECAICPQLKRNENCSEKMVIYQYECKICSQRYIGKTINSIRMRHYKHHYAFRDENSFRESALAAHIADKHPGSTADINCFHINIVSRCS